MTQSQSRSYLGHLFFCSLCSFAVESRAGVASLLHAGFVAGVVAAEVALPFPDASLKVLSRACPWPPSGGGGATLPSPRVSTHSDDNRTTSVIAVPSADCSGWAPK
jgi:hypothetical protein